MELLLLFGTAAAASVFWFIPVWATCALYSSQLGWPPWLVGLVAASAQCVGYSGLYAAGDRLAGAWPGFAKRVESARLRWSGRLDHAYLPSTVLGGLTGVPPMVALAALAPAFEVPLAPFLGCVFVGRVVRFTLFAGAGQGLMAWLGR
jgi:membrane protein YqaA with SNARE-associated domain